MNHFTLKKLEVWQMKIREESEILEFENQAHRVKEIVVASSSLPETGKIII